MGQSPSYVPVIPTDRDITFSGDITFTGTVNLDAATVTSGAQAITVAAAGTDAISVDVTGDSVVRYVVNGDGFLQWGPGNAALDTNLFRNGVARLASNGRFESVRAASTNMAFAAFVTGDSFTRLSVDAAGLMVWGDGAGAGDTNLYRSAANTLKTDDALIITGHTEMSTAQTSGSFTFFSGSNAAVDLSTAGGGIAITEGANCRMGVATLVGGTVTVNNTSVTANTRIFLTVQTLGTVATPQAVHADAVVAGTSFDITSADGTDTSTIAWLLFEPS